jgi:hypothetical protein
MAEWSFDGDVDLDFAPTGLRWRLVCPSSKVLDEHGLRARQDEFSVPARQSDKLQDIAGLKS